MSKVMGISRFAVALIWAFTMLGAVGVVSLTGHGVSGASSLEKGKDKGDDHGNGGGNGGGGGQGNGGDQVNGGSEDGSDDDGSDDATDDGTGDATDDGTGEDGDDEGAAPESWVTICHATGSASNPYVELTINVNAADNGHGNHAGDLISAPEGGCPVATDDDATDDDATDDDATDDGTDGDEDDADDQDGDGETKVVVDLDEAGQGTITFDLDGDGTVDFTILIGQGHGFED